MCLHFVLAHFYCKICFVSKYWLLRENFWYIFWTCIVHIYCATDGLFHWSWNCLHKYNPLLLITISWISYLGPVFLQRLPSLYFEKAINTSLYLYREVLMFLASVWSSLIRMYPHFPNIFFVKWTMIDAAIIRSHNIILKNVFICSICF